MSALAECYPDGCQLSSHQVAELRSLSQPLAAKVLTVLSQAGFVVGTRGPGGGYKLAVDPKKVSLFDIVNLFEGHRDPSLCPFGPGWCGTGEPCPLHDMLTDLNEAVETTLKEANFGSFIAQGPVDDRRSK
jgi:Rrf2 family protein